MNTTEVPFISDELIKYLEEIFPDKCPVLGTPERMVWYNSGQASVVRHLKSARNRSIDSQLE